MKIWNQGYFVFEQLKKGNQKAFESLFKETYPLLCQFCVGFVGDADIAEELVQDFFFNFWKNREIINIKTSLKSYMYASVRNSSLNHIEKQKVRKGYAEMILLSGAEDSVAFDDEFNYKELKTQIGNILQDLPPRCAKVFSMSRYEGFSNNQIAEKLSVSIKTVEADLTKSLKLLRSRLEYQNIHGHKKTEKRTNE